MRIVRGIGITLAVLVAVVVLLAYATRFSDGPIGPFPGGKLRGERVADASIDWTAVTDGVPRIELEVSPNRPRSVTTSYMIHDGKLYVPSMLASRKQWPQEALADDRVVLRIGGKLYERRAIRVTDRRELRALVGASRDAGAVEPDADALSTWYFRMDPRT